jgi:hypothetical protein
LADEKPIASAHPAVSADIGTFDQILYWIYTSTDEFDLPTFRAALPEGVRNSDDDEVRCSPQEGQSGSYHAFLGWQIAEDELTLTVDYHVGGMDPASDETEPYAEGLLRWLAQFFSTPAVTAHVHVRLRYATAGTESKIPFALTVPLPYHADLYGVALALKEKPNGAMSVRLTRGQSYLYAEVVGERTIHLNRATPLDDVAAFREVLSAFVEEKRA